MNDLATTPAPSRMRTIANWSLRLGALVSVALTLYAGRHNPSLLLPVLFVLWVLSPFLGLIAAQRIAHRSPAHIAKAIHAATLVLTLCAVLIYALVDVAPPPHIAFAFLAVPAACWLAILTLLIAARLATKNRKK
jgi:hypothetical protein